MTGQVDEAYERLSNTDEDLVRDAGIILAAQKIEHYEIATYGTLIAFAKTMGQDEIAKILEETLEEEKKADQTWPIWGNFSSTKELEQKRIPAPQKIRIRILGT